MATTTYEWMITADSFTANTITTGHQRDPAIATVGKDSFLATWSQPDNAFSAGRFVSGNGTPFEDTQFQVNSTSTGLQYDTAAAGLNSGRSVVTFTDTSVDAGGDIRVRMFDRDGETIDLDFGAAVAGDDDTASDVAALSDGGFVVSWSRDFGGGVVRPRAAVFSPNGTFENELVGVSLVSAKAGPSSVAGMTDGGFVVAWAQSPTAGGDSEVYYRRFDATGLPLDDDPVLIDTAGGINEDIQVVGLADGGFAVAYTDNGWLGDATEITVAMYDADGTLRGEAQRANEITSGVQDRPTLTQLSNGFVVVGWSNDTGLIYQAFDAQAGLIGANYQAAGSVVEAEIAALAGGRVANARWSTVSDGDGNSIRVSVDELVRTTEGDNSNEVITGDDLRDLLNGLGGKDRLTGAGGKDTLDGGDGDDVLRGGADRDQLIGGIGADKYVYSDVLQSRPGDPADSIKGFEHLIDVIDVEAIDAKAGKAGDQAFKLITGEFTAEGQVRAVQFMSATLLEFNTTGVDGAEMEILLKTTTAATLTAADFVL